MGKPSKEESSPGEPAPRSGWGWRTIDTIIPKNVYPDAEDRL